MDIAESRFVPLWDLERNTSLVFKAAAVGASFLGTRLQGERIGPGLGQEELSILLPASCRDCWHSLLPLFQRYGFLAFSSPFCYADELGLNNN